MRLLTTTTPEPSTDYADSEYDEAMDATAADDAEDDEDDATLEDDLPSDDRVELSSSTPATDDSFTSTRSAPSELLIVDEKTNTSSLVNVTSFIPVGSTIATTVPSPLITSDLSVVDTYSEVSVTLQSVVTDNQDKVQYEICLIRSIVWTLGLYTYSISP